MQLSDFQVLSHEVVWFPVGVGLDFAQVKRNQTGCHSFHGKTFRWSQFALNTTS